MFVIGTPEPIFIFPIVLLLFGGKNIPELMKALGKGVRSFKDGMNGLDPDAPSEKKTDKPTPEEPKHDGQ